MGQPEIQLTASKVSRAMSIILRPVKPTLFPTIPLKITLQITSMLHSNPNHHHKSRHRLITSKSQVFKKVKKNKGLLTEKVSYNKTKQHWINNSVKLPRTRLTFPPSILSKFLAQGLLEKFFSLDWYPITNCMHLRLSKRRISSSKNNSNTPLFKPTFSSKPIISSSSISILLSKLLTIFILLLTIAQAEIWVSILPDK